MIGFILCSAADMLSFFLDFVLAWPTTLSWVLCLAFLCSLDVARCRECMERREEKSTICSLHPLVTENSKFHDFEVVVSMRKFPWGGCHL